MSDDRYLGPLCVHGHDDGGGSLRYRSNRTCVRCHANYYLRRKRGEIRPREYTRSTPSRSVRPVDDPLVHVLGSIVDGDTAAPIAGCGRLLRQARAAGLIRKKELIVTRRGRKLLSAAQ